LGAEFCGKRRVGNDLRCIGQGFGNNQLDWHNVIASSQLLPNIELAEAEPYSMYANRAQQPPQHNLAELHLLLLVLLTTSF
jgi:hypothetical protein